jgi:hypothetical protein
MAAANRPNIHRSVIDVDKGVVTLIDTLEITSCGPLSMTVHHRRPRHGLAGKPSVSNPRSQRRMNMKELNEELASTPAADVQIIHSTLLQGAVKAVCYATNPPSFKHFP